MASASRSGRFSNSDPWYPYGWLIYITSKFKFLRLVPHVANEVIRASDSVRPRTSIMSKIGGEADLPVKAARSG